ncbi:MAG: hypothetical protein K0B10_12820 [Vicingaceae bacterium]|nr:hypothetical protein [Vicingaceae bacterium]
MKTLKIFAAMALCSGLLFNTSSCVVVKKDGKRPPEWFKNTNNPHHPNSTNPGKGNSKGKHKHR